MSALPSAGSLDPYDSKPEDVLRPEALQEYRRTSEVIWNALVRLHSNLSMMGQVSAFDWKLFEVSAVAFYLIWISLLEYGVAIVHRVGLDLGPEKITLHRLQRIVLNGARPAYEVRVRERLAELRTDRRRLCRAFHRMDKLRDRSLAHSIEGYVFDNPREHVGVSFEELRQVADYLGRLCNTLHFGSEMRFVSVEVYPGEDGKGGDLGYVLDLIAANSNVVRLWDEHPEVWERCYRARLSREQLDEVNRIRRWRRLPPIPDEPTARGA